MKRSTMAKRKKDRQAAHIAEAEWLIRELDSHQGAEGWSEYLKKRLDAFQFQTEPKK